MKKPAKSEYKTSDRVTVLVRTGKTERLFRIETVKAVTPSGGIISESNRHYTLKDYRIRPTTKRDESDYEKKTIQDRERRDALNPK